MGVAHKLGGDVTCIRECFVSGKHEGPLQKQKGDLPWACMTQASASPCGTDNVSRCPHRRRGGRRKRRIIAGIEIGEFGVSKEGIFIYRVLVNALWRRRARRACRVLEEIRPECGGEISIGPVGAVHGVVWVGV